MGTQLDDEIVRFVEKAGPKGRRLNEIAEQSSGRAASVVKRHTSNLVNERKLAKIGERLRTRYVMPRFAGRHIEGLLKQMRNTLPGVTNDGVVRYLGDETGFVGREEGRVLTGQGERVAFEHDELFPDLQRYDAFDGARLGARWKGFKSAAVEFNGAIDKLDRLLHEYSVVRLFPTSGEGKAILTRAGVRWLRRKLFSLAIDRTEELAKVKKTVKSTVEFRRDGRRPAGGPRYVYILAGSEVIERLRLIDLRSERRRLAEKRRLDTVFRRILREFSVAATADEVSETMGTLLRAGCQVRELSQALETLRGRIYRDLDDALDEIGA